MLRIENLKTKIIGPVSFQLATGDCVALMGPSGSGKSLLLRAIADLDPNEGHVSFNHHSRNDMPASAWRKTLALVPAESGWWADRVGDHFMAGACVEPLLHDVGLPDSNDWEVSRLSTGERQRLAIVRALCHNPQVLLLDEPTASLDDAATRKVENLIRLCCARDMSVLLVTHDRQQAQRMASIIMTMSDGTITNPKAAAV